MAGGAPKDASEDRVSHCAAFLLDAHLSRVPCFLGDLIDEPYARGLTYAEAYEVQRRLHDRLAETLGPVAGLKVGATTPGMQKHLHVSHPMPGTMHASRMIEWPGKDGEPLRLERAKFNGPSVECEITVRVGPAGLDARGKALSLEEVLAALDTVHASAELVDDRYGGDRMGEDNWKREGMQAIMVADSFFHWSCLRARQGVPSRDMTVEDFEGLEGHIELNGRIVQSGSSRLVLGNPLESVKFMAEFLAEHRGEALPPGSWVMTGSVTMPVLPKAGDSLRVWFDGLPGEVRVTY
ncbi:hypothetical protein DFJ74DRAFT_695673 [Hyaloraphidium curvatum]|nr:hypothetical protein DFJ74DRAFT_695673 [Hyaloraphidium curvatum]